MGHGLYLLILAVIWIVNQIAAAVKRSSQRNVPPPPPQRMPQPPAGFGAPPPGAPYQLPQGQQQGMQYQYVPTQAPPAFGGPPPGVPAYPAAPPAQPAMPYQYTNPAQMRPQAVPPISATTRQSAPAASARRAPARSAEAPNQEQLAVRSDSDARIAPEGPTQVALPSLESMLQAYRPLLASVIMHEVLAPPVAKRGQLGLNNWVS